MSATGTGNMLVQHLEGSGVDIDTAVVTPAFFDANLKVAYDFKLYDSARLRLPAGTQNTSHTYQSDSDKRALPDPGYLY